MAEKGKLNPSDPQTQKVAKMGKAISEDIDKRSGKTISSAKETLKRMKKTAGYSKGGKVGGRKKYI
jgi:hypothetical protein